MKELVKIQRMCFSDGPGIRTVLFLKGCPLTCPWCCNVENTDKGLKTISNISGDSVNNVNANFDKNLYGDYYTEDELISIILKDKNYFLDDGGVTFSGGEPLLHDDFIKSICAKLKEQNINIAIETSLCTSIDKIKKVYEFIYFYYVDIKTLDNKVAKEIFNIDLNMYKENLSYLSKNIKRDNKKLVLRWTIAKNINDGIVEDIIELMKNNGLNEIEICSVHNLGKTKYDKLGIEYKDFEVLDIGTLNSIKNRFENEEIHCKINKI